MCQVSPDGILESDMPESVASLEPLQEQYQHLAATLGDSVEKKYVIVLVALQVVGVVGHQVQSEEHIRL